MKTRYGGVPDVKKFSTETIYRQSTSTLDSRYPVSWNIEGCICSFSQRIVATVNCVEQKRLLMDLDISMRTADCPFTVQSYGALFREGDVWICMEVMDLSLDRFYPKVYKNGFTIPENIIEKIAYAVSTARILGVREMKFILIYLPHRW